MLAFPIQVLGIPFKYRCYPEMDVFFKMWSDYIRAKRFMCSTYNFLNATRDCTYILKTVIVFVSGNKEGYFKN